METQQIGQRVDVVRVADAFVALVHRVPKARREPRACGRCDVVLTVDGLEFPAQPVTAIATNRERAQYLAQLGVQRGSADEEYLRSLKRNFLLDSAGSELQNIQKLDKKRIDIWITDTLASAYYQAKTGVQLKQHFIFRTTLRALACHANTSNILISKLSASLKKHYKTGRINDIILEHTKNLKFSPSNFEIKNNQNKKRQ